MIIFSILILLINEHGEYFHHMRWSSFFFFKHMKFLSYKSFTFLVRVFPNLLCYYFRLLWSVLLPSFFFSPFTARQLIAWVNFVSSHLFTSYKSSLVEFLESLISLIYTTMSTTNNQTLISSYTICIRLISFSCHISLAETSSTTLKRIWTKWAAISSSWF